jgi:filamentous hemagglutinin family protein
MFSDCHDNRLVIRSLYLAIFGIVFCPTIASSQVRVDNTLGNENSVVVQDVSVNRIDGGAIRGHNLFHSFSEFNVSEGQGVYFNNPQGITNIFSRVTGNNSSSILGKLGVLGNANLFLMNPNGIIFGPHASLDLGGSFVATTANAIQFNEQGVFSASSPETPPLLTVNPSAFIFNRLRPSSISLNSSREVAGERIDIFSETGLSDTFGLQVPDGHSLILLGGDVTLTNSHLNALEGRVELGSVAETGTIGLTVENNTLSLNFPNNLALGDVSLAKGSRVYTGGDRSGDIQITANNIRLTGGSVLSSETFGSQLGGTLALTAKDTIEIIEGAPIENPSPNVSTISYGSGNAANIMFNTKKLIVNEGAQISTGSIGKGLGGELNINALESVELIGISSDGTGTGSGLTSFAGAEGKGGLINIKTKDLILRNGGFITTQSFGSSENNSTGNIASGAGGDVIVNASNSVTIFEGDDITAETSGTGNAGNITINTGVLTIQKAGKITVASVYQYGAEGASGNLTINASKAVNLSGKDSRLEATGSLLGKAGNLTIKTGQMNISDGAIVTVNNLEGQAGNLTIEADSLLVTGKKSSIIGSTESGQAGNIYIRAGNSVILNDQGEISVQADGIGKAGNLTIETGELQVSGRARATVSSTKGQAGNLSIYADNVFLDRGFLTAETAETGVNGANIDLQLSNLLKMQNESLISAQATGGANGGNVTINSPLLAVLLPTGPNGSDIIAKAEAGNGGNILINSQGIFGTAEGKAIAGNQSNDIDASSEFGAPGRVLINNTIDPNQGTVTLPEDVVDPNTLVAQNACKRGTASQLTQTGRGGLPPTISENLNSQAIAVGLVDPAPSSMSQAENQAIVTQDSSIAQNQIVPAQGWIFNQKGEVMLVAYDPTVTGSQRVKVNPLGCVVP